MSLELHLTYWHKGVGWKGQIWGKRGSKSLGVIADGMFPSMSAVKQWARSWAHSKRAKLTMEQWR